MKKIENCQKTVTYLCYSGNVVNDVKKEYMPKTKPTLLSALSVAIYALLAMPAYAGIFDSIGDAMFAGLSPMEGVLCRILLIIIGDAGRGIATLAVMSMGIGAMLGKVSWGQALTVAVGIGVMFGSPFLLPLLMFDVTNFSFDMPCTGS